MARRGTPVRREGRRPLIAGNWKMNLTHLEAIGMVQKLAFSLKEPELEAAEVVVLPPFTRAAQRADAGGRRQARGRLRRAGPLVQDSGAYTGEVSGAMLAALACRYVVIGHSERRALHAEDDAVVAGKVQAALRHGLVPILCVGEGLEVRRAGEHVAHCTTQLDAALEGLTAEQLTAPGEDTGIVIAYEPVWAIGTGEVATPEDAQEVCRRLTVTARRAFRRGDGRDRPYPLRRVGEGREHGRDPGRAGRRRCPRRWRQPGRRRVRADLSDSRRRRLTAAAGRAGSGWGGEHAGAGPRLGAGHSRPGGRRRRRRPAGRRDGGQLRRCR
jgi:triosephosphate isomerase